MPPAAYAARMVQRLSRSESHRWAANQPRGRFERVLGTPVSMATERWVPLRRQIIQHTRVGERIETRIIRSGAVELDPPGIRLTLDEIYGD